MKPKLYFSKMDIETSDLGDEAALPDIIGEINIQNKTKFNLNEDEEIYVGYGQVHTAYPYRQFNTYNRVLQHREISVAVLENSFLKATFLPDYGGRLWSLIDKETEKNLLYTNDVIRPSNLALRNAWFSGGVEWNIGMIGHHPYTMSPLFTAHLQDDAQNPVLRFYEFERVRKVAYQMDFWLEENCRFLNCRMRIFNQSENTIPMYWWSNMAVPQYQGGRVVVPAQEAYTNNNGMIEKVEIPYTGGKDVTKYENIETQIDYFFNIPEKELKYIANINQKGYGLLQRSTSRLQGRKLFCWGKNEGSDRWQEFLTEQAGRYVEIQAGLGKTQYGCIPMAPDTAWEWMEQYGAIQIRKEAVDDFKTAQKEVSECVNNINGKQQLEDLLISSRTMAMSVGKIVNQGSGYGYLENIIRRENGYPPIAPQLDFSSPDKQQKEWISFMQTGQLSRPNPKDRPSDYIFDDYLYQKLIDSVSDQEADNWYVWLHIGLYELYYKRYKEAKEAFLTSVQLEENAWADICLAVIAIIEKDNNAAKERIFSGIKQNRKDLSYAKDAFKLLQKIGAYQEIIELYHKLPKEIENESRMVLYYIIALKELGEEEKAYKLLTADEGLIVDDIREGEDSVGALWEELYMKLYPNGKNKMPHQYHFKSF